MPVVVRFSCLVVVRFSCVVVVRFSCLVVVKLLFCRGANMSCYGVDSFLLSW